MGSDQGVISLSLVNILSQLGETQAALTESLRRSFKPEKIIVLLVGEAPPPNGTFFYRCDSNLFRYTRDAFAAAFGLQFQSDSDFLVFFRDHGFFLDDLKLTPISKDDRRRQRQFAVGSLAARIENHQPNAVIIVMKGIQAHVRQAISLVSARPSAIYAVDFPTHGHQSDYVRNLSAILRELMAAGAI